MICKKLNDFMQVPKSHAECQVQDGYHLRPTYKSIENLPGYAVPRYVPRQRVGIPLSKGVPVPRYLRGLEIDFEIEKLHLEDLEIGDLGDGFLSEASTFGIDLSQGSEGVGTDLGSNDIPHFDRRSISADQIQDPGSGSLESSDSEALTVCKASSATRIPRRSAIRGKCSRGTNVLFSWVFDRGTRDGRSS